jgi:hypothetical protein
MHFERSIGIENLGGVLHHRTSEDCIHFHKIYREDGSFRTNWHSHQCNRSISHIMTKLMKDIVVVTRNRQNSMHLMFDMG